MAVITPEIKEFIKNNLGWITTVSKDGELDLGPKMSLFVLDDTHIAYHERTAGQHYENLKNGSPLVIAFANLEKNRATASAATWRCTLTTTSTTSRSRSPRKRAPRSRP